MYTSRSAWKFKKGDIIIGFLRKLLSFLKLFVIVSTSEFIASHQIFNTLIFLNVAYITFQCDFVSFFLFTDNMGIFKQTYLSWYLSIYNWYSSTCNVLFPCLLFFLYSSLVLALVPPFSSIIPATNCPHFFYYPF